MKNHTLIVIQVLFICQLSLSELRSQDNQNPDFLAVGLTIVDSSKIYKKPDLNSEVLSTLKYITPLKIYNKISFRENKRVYYWFKITDLNGLNEGWITNKNCAEIDTGIIDLNNINYANIYYHAAMYAWRYGYEESTEKLLNILLKYFSQDQILIIKQEPVLQKYPIDAEVAIFNAFAWLRSRQADYLKSIEYFEKAAAVKNATPNQRLEAYTNILRLFRRKLINDESLMLKYCYRIIENFPNEKYEVYEGIRYPDINAAMFILDKYFSSADYNNLNLHCNKILSKTKNSAVLLIAQSGIIAYEIYQQKYEIVKEKLKHLLYNYPDEQRPIFKCSVNYSIFPLAYSIETVLRERGNYDKAVEFVQLVEKISKSDKVKYYARYKLTQLLYESDSSMDHLLENLVSEMEICFYDPVLKNVPISKILKYKIIKINSTEKESAIANQSIIPFKQGLRSKTLNQLNVTDNIQVTILYKEDAVADYNNKTGFWTKIELPNGKIGWTLDNYLDTIGAMPIFKPLNISDETKLSDGANQNSKCYHNTSPIKKPTILNTLENLNNKETYFLDINDDKILDIMAYSKNGLVAIDGSTQKTIWLFECNNGSIPISNKSEIYIIAYSIKGEYLYALNKYTGEEVWSEFIGSERQRFGPPAPVIDQNKIYTVKNSKNLLCIDLQSKDQVWQIKNESSINSSYLIFDNDFIFSTRNNNLFAINKTTGKYTWEYKLSSNEIGGTIFGLCSDKENIYLNNKHGYVYAINAKTGKLTWKTKFLGDTDKMSNRGSKPCIENDLVIFAYTDKIMALSAITGEIDWQYTNQEIFSGNPVICNKSVYVRSMAGFVHSLSLNTGELLWKIKIGSTGGFFTPSFVQDLIFIGSNEGHLYTIGETQ